MIRLLLLWLFFFAPAAPTLTVISPAPYQVIQRQNGMADIAVSGYVTNLSSYTVEASIDGLNWNTLASFTTPFFQAVLTGIPQGQYTISVRAGGVQRDIAFVGIGDVFVIGGQSNASGRLVYRQAYAHPTLKAGLFCNSYVWCELKDFTDSITNQRDKVSAGDSGVGSIWPLVATHFMADQNVPVAFVPCAKGGSSITQWQPAYPLSQTTLYGSCINRIKYVGGVKAVLWLQGETDAGTYMAADLYEDYLNTLADAFQADAGVSMVVAQLHYLTAAIVTPAAQMQIRQAIFAADAVNPNIITGPDLSVIRATDTVGQHFTTNAAGQLAADLWWQALKTVFYS
jgi:hypothetical protein